MAKEVDLYPGVVYETAGDGIYVVADQCPDHADGTPQTDTDVPWWTSYHAGFVNSDLRLRPISRGTDHPDLILRLHQPLTRDEMVQMLDVSDFQEDVQESFLKNLIGEIDANLQKPVRRLIAPNIAE